MIEAGSFVEIARDYGYTRYTGVPCSFLTPFINYVINDDSLGYLSSANEGDAVATAAGMTIGGQRSVVMMQNSGLGNAVSPLTSLTWVFDIPVLLIVTHRGAPGVDDEPQHELTGRITADLLDKMQIPREPFPDTEPEIKPALQRAHDYMNAVNRPYAFIMQKGTVAPHALRKSPQKKPAPATADHRVFPGSGELSSRNDVLRRIVSKTSIRDSVIIASTGYTGRELYAIDDRPNHLYMVGSMGCASAFGLGLALSRPDFKVVVLDGDGAALMRMGNFATLGHYGGANLVHILLDNEAHDSTGAQATVSGSVNFADIARACSYPLTFQGNDPAMLDEVLDMSHGPGPRFCHLKIRSGTIKDLPRPETPPKAVLRRFMDHIHSGF